MWFFALNMTWTHCEVFWDLDSEPSENQRRAASGIRGVRYLVWRLVFVLDFDNWSMGAKPWNTIGGQPVVFGLSGKTQTTQSHKPAQFKQTCLGSLMVNGSTLWVMYQGFVHLDTETRAAELHWSFLFLVNLAPLLMIPIPAALVCPKTCDTVAENACVKLPVTFPLAVLTISEEYSGSLEADMSENHRAYSSVKWEVLPFFCLSVSWVQSAGHSHVQVARVYGKGSFESRSQAAPLQAALVCLKTWQKTLATLPVSFSLTLLTISEVFTQSWSRHSRESLSQPRWDRFKQTQSQQPGGGAHTRTLTTLNRVCWGQAFCRANRCVSLHAELQSCLMSHSALVIVSAWFRGLLCGNRWNKSKALLGATTFVVALQAFSRP